MRFIFDISHPAHVHFFRFIVEKLEGLGHETRIVARNKDVTHSLLDAFGMRYQTIGRSGHTNRLSQLVELLDRDLRLSSLARKFAADVVVTRNPSGVQAARLSGAIGVFDTDDGRAAGLHFRAAYPFAHYITTPDCLDEDYGARHIRYCGYKQSAYLHPNQFTPDPTVLSRLGIRPGEKYFIVRIVEMLASHDRGESGISDSLAKEVIGILQQHGKVFLSSEGHSPSEFANLSLPLPAKDIHHALAFAQLYVGDSQTMAAEAAVLGTPSLRMSSFTGRLDYLEELENRYGLIFSYLPHQSESFLEKLTALSKQSDCRTAFTPGHKKMLDEKVDVAEWYTRFLVSLEDRAGEQSHLTSC